MAKDSVDIGVDTDDQGTDVSGGIVNDVPRIFQTPEGAIILGTVELEVGDRLRLRIEDGQDGTRVVIVELIKKNNGGNGTVPPVGTRRTEGLSRMSLHQLDGRPGDDPVVLMSPAPDGRTMHVTVEAPPSRGKPIKPWPTMDTP